MVNKLVRRARARPPRPRTADRCPLAHDRRWDPARAAASILNREAAIAGRNGCFCAHPYLHRLLGLEDTTELRQRLMAGEEVDLPGAVRPSFGIFNDEEDVDELVRMIRVIRDRAWQGEYGDIPGAAACKEL